MAEFELIGVVGAGNMGAGIAQKIAQEGLNVVLVDVKEEFVRRGLDNIKATLSEAVKRKILSQEQADAVLARVKGTTDTGELANADFVIEAIFEDEQVKKELVRMIKITNTMLNLSFERFEKRSTVLEKKILDRESAVDSVTEDIIRYLTKISQKTLGLRLSNQLTNLMHIAYDIERTGDHAESILYLIRVKEDNNMVLSKAELDELQKGFDQVKYMFKVLTIGIEDDSLSKLKKCESIEAGIDELVREARTNHLIRLRKEECPPNSGVIFADIILHLERIGDLLYAISRNLLNIKEYNI